MSKTLIVYYSYTNGNTKRIAEMIQEKIGADIIRIDTAKPYEGTYRQISDQGKRECETGFMPDITPSNIDISPYDTVIVGTPTWWYTMAPAVLTFMRNTNFSGKTVIPFMTNGGWRGKVIENMTKEANGAIVKLPFEIKFDSDGGDILETPMDEIEKWIDDITTEVTK